MSMDKVIFVSVFCLPACVGSPEYSLKWLELLYLNSALAF